MNILHYYREALYYGDTLAAKKCIKKRFKCCHNLYRKTILGHYGCVNSISFSNDGELFSSGCFSIFSRGGQYFDMHIFSQSHFFQ